MTSSAGSRLSREEVLALLEAEDDVEEGGDVDEVFFPAVTRNSDSMRKRRRKTKRKRKMRRKRKRQRKMRRKEKRKRRMRRKWKRKRKATCLMTMKMG